MRFNRRKPPLGAPGRPEGRRAGAGRGQAGRRGRLSAGRTVRAVRAAAAGAGAAGSGGAGGRRGGGRPGPAEGVNFARRAQRAAGGEPASLSGAPRPPRLRGLGVGSRGPGGRKATVRGGAVFTSGTR